MCVKYVTLQLRAIVSCIVVVCPRITDPWTNHDQAENDMFPFFRGHDYGRRRRAFLFILFAGLLAGLSHGPPVIDPTGSEPQYSRCQPKGHPQSSRRCLPRVLSFREEGVKPRMMRMTKTSTFHSLSMTNPQHDPLYQTLSLRHVGLRFVSAEGIVGATLQICLMTEQE